MGIIAYIEQAIADRLHDSIKTANIRIFPDDSDKDPRPTMNTQLIVGYAGSNYNLLSNPEFEAPTFDRKSRFEILFRVKDLRSHVPVLRLLDTVIDSIVGYRIALDNSRPIEPQSDRFVNYNDRDGYWFYSLTVQLVYTWYVGQEVQVQEDVFDRYIERGGNSIRVTTGLWRSPLSSDAIADRSVAEFEQQLQGRG